jgi:hypothetical protein
MLGSDYSHAISIRTAFLMLLLAITEAFSSTRRVPLTLENMDEDLFDAAGRRVFPLPRRRALGAQAGVVPGTSRPRRIANPTSGDVPGRVLPDKSRVAERDDRSPTWARSPKFLPGRSEAYYTIGALAQALGRSPTTVRAWIREGWMPDSTRRSGTRDMRGSRRMYTRAQIEGLVRIAHEELLLDTKHRDPASTHFPQRARALFAQLATEARRTA